MSNHLGGINRIEKEGLSGEFYLQSLLEQGYAKGFFLTATLSAYNMSALPFSLIWRSVSMPATAVP